MTSLRGMAAVAVARNKASDNYFTGVSPAYEELEQISIGSGKTIQ